MQDEARFCGRYMAFLLVVFALMDGIVGYEGLFADFEALMDRRVGYTKRTMHGMGIAFSYCMLV